MTQQELSKPGVLGGHRLRAGAREAVKTSGALYPGPSSPRLGEQGPSCPRREQTHGEQSHREQDGATGHRRACWGPWGGHSPSSCSQISSGSAPWHTGQPPAGQELRSATNAATGQDSPGGTPTTTHLALAPAGSPGHACASARAVPLSSWASLVPASPPCWGSPRAPLPPASPTQREWLCRWAARGGHSSAPAGISQALGISCPARGE